MAKPGLIKSIPSQVINEQASYGPLNLNDFIKAPEGSPRVEFNAGLAAGQGLPQGLICTPDGQFTGIPARNTQGNYEVLVEAYNEDGSVNTTFNLTIKPSLLEPVNLYADKLKAQVWEAVNQNLPIPDISELYDRPITIQEVYYLLERWATLTIWDAFNLEPPGEKVLIKVEGASEHYNVYDRGSCLVASPKDLFSHERTIEDGMRTARAVAKEAYKRGWTMELVGFDKMSRAAWIELQYLAEQYGRQVEVINFKPRLEDLKIFAAKTFGVDYRRTPD